MIFFNILKTGLRNVLLYLKLQLQQRRLRQKIHHLDARIKTRYATIGEQVYQSRGQLDAAAPKVDKEGREIASLETQKVSLQQELKALKHSLDYSISANTQVSYVAKRGLATTCFACDSLIPVASAYCPHCGTKQEKA
jgi:hypothetical protein